MKILLWLCALGAAVSSGVLLAFSSFVMAGLARISAPAGIAAMQAINVTVINPLFMGVYFGTGLLCAIAAVLVWRGAPGVTPSLVYAAAVIYIFGVLGVTIAFNVPMNDALAQVDANSAEAAAYWRTYLSQWTNWNHLRCAAAAVSAALMMWAAG